MSKHHAAVQKTLLRRACEEQQGARNNYALRTDATHELLCDVLTWTLHHATRSRAEDTHFEQMPLTSGRLRGQL